MGVALKIANGILAGAVGNRDVERQRRERAQQQDAQNLELLSRISGNDQFQVGQQPTDVPPGSRPLQVAKIALGGQQVPVTYDPTQSRKAKKDAANRAAHTRLQTDESAVWGEYDPDFDYASAERENRNQKAIEDGLVAEGMPRTRAHLLAKNNIDMDKRQRDAEAAKATANSRAVADQARTDASRRTQLAATEKEATDYASSLAIRGRAAKKDDATMVTEITEELKASHPSLSQAQRAGIAAKAVQSSEMAAANIDAKNRTGRRGLKIGGITIDPDSVANATGAEGGRAAAPKKESRKELIRRLIQEGKSDQEIAAEVKRRGL